MERKKPTLIDVAHKAGVSKATASRALQNHPRQSRETCERVQAVAKEMGYIRHPLVSALMTEIRKKRPSTLNTTLALVHGYHMEFDPPPSLIHLRKGAIEAAETNGYKLEEFFLWEPGMTPQRLISILASRGIYGVIFEQIILKQVQEVKLPIDLSKFAAVAIEFSLQEPNLNRVDIDQYNGLLMAFKETRKRGYHRIGLVTNRNEEHLCQKKRLAAMYLVHQTIPVSQRIPPLVTNDYVTELGTQLPEWIKKHKVEAILSPRRLLPKELGALGFKVPDDIGFAQLMVAENQIDGYSGVMPRWTMVGEIAVNQVIGLLNRNDFGVPQYPTATYAPGVWVDGDTLPDINGIHSQAKKTTIATKQF
jgi:LacI family transcriptional regulator